MTILARTWSTIETFLADRKMIQMEQERRRVPRFQFIAPAELVEEKSGVAVSSWVSDLGVGGCSLGMKDPPPLGTEVRLKIGNNPRETFEAKAQIVHSHPNHVGVAFYEVKPMSSLVLHKWLASAKFPKGHA